MCIQGKDLGYSSTGFYASNVLHFLYIQIFLIIFFFFSLEKIDLEATNVIGLSKCYVVYFPARLCMFYMLCMYVSMHYTEKKGKVSQEHGDQYVSFIPPTNEKSYVN